MAKFKVGDKVFFYGKPATVKQIIREPDADYILDVQGSEFYAEDEEVTSRNSARSTNAVVQNAINARRARDADVGKALMDAISARRKLAETARKEGNEEERQRAIKAGTALYGMKPSW